MGGAGPRAGGRSRAALANVSLILFGSLVAALLVEGGLRLRGGAPSRGGAHEEGLYKMDPEGLFTLRPHHQLMWPAPELSGTVTINSQGFRGPDPDTLPPGRRILVLGDSFVFGWGVDDGETLPARLEAILNAGSPPGGGVCVLNLGVPGYGPGREAALLRRRGIPLEPDLVLLVLTESNDVLDDLLYERDPLKPAGDRLTGLAAKSRLLQFLDWKIRGLSRWFRMTREENVRRTLKNVSAMAALCDDRGIPLVAATFPAKVQMEPSGPTAWILERLDVDGRLVQPLRGHLRREQRIAAVVDLTETLVLSGDGLYFPVDGHPTPRAYEACAMALAPVLARALPDPTRPAAGP